jgi:hypothetical protein
MIQVIAVRDEADAERLEAICLERGRQRQLLVRWWGLRVGDHFADAFETAVGGP